MEAQQQESEKTTEVKVAEATYRVVLHEGGKSLEVEVARDASGDLFTNAWDDSNFSPSSVFAQLEAKKFSSAFSKGECVITLEGGAKLKLPLGKSLDDNEKLMRQLRRNEEERRWKRVGTIDDYDALMARYPFAEWKWGGTYNNVNPMPLVVLQWNRGLRVTFKHPYPQGDDGGAMTMGNAVWTRGTDDKQTQECKNPDGSPGFYHRYIGVDGKPHMGANGRGGLAIWVKRY